jgi:hypothetical protein
VYCQQSDLGLAASADWRNIDLPDANGIITSGNYIVSYTALVASRIFDVRIGVAGMRFVRCYPTVTAAGANDLITSTYTLFN